MDFGLIRPSVMTKTKTISNTVGWEKAMAPFASDVTRIRIFLELPAAGGACC
jgi:hypothetical protein